MSVEQNVLNYLIKSKTATVGSEILREVESNNDYIRDIQLKKLTDLHDKSFKEKGMVPLIKLYEKYNAKSVEHGDLQNWAELIDRDLRVLETTIQILDEERNE